MKQTSLIVLIVLLSSCSHHPVSDINSPLYSVPAGSTLSLNRDILIAPNRARVYIQNDTVHDSVNDINEYYPYCEFEILTLSEQPQRVHADTFIISRVVDETLTSNKPLLYASLRLTDTAPLLIAYNTVYYLKSDQQPDVYRLMCLYWTDLGVDDFLSFTEIRQTLGTLITFQVSD